MHSADAEAEAAALDHACAERRPYDDAMADHQGARDVNALPVYEFSSGFAKLEPPAMQQLIGAMQGDQGAMGEFGSVTAGTFPAPDLLGPENAARIAAHQAATSRQVGAVVALAVAVTTMPRFRSVATGTDR